MLPNINLNPISKDSNPMTQISALRNQLAMLKDAVEESLNNISYDNLNTLLKKKIDEIDKIKAYAQESADIVAQSIVVDMLKVNNDIEVVNGNINVINGSISTINGDITSIKGNISTVEGNISTMKGDISTAEGNISALNGTVSGLRGEFNTLNAKAITTDNITTQNLNASQITGGKIQASQINAKSIASSLLSGEDLHVNELTCNLSIEANRIDVSTIVSADELVGNSLDVGIVDCDNMRAKAIKGYSYSWKKHSAVTSNDYVLVGSA